MFSYIDSSNENLELLRSYLHELVVNRKPCRVFRHSAATKDVVHPSCVATDNFTGKVTWIKQVLEKHSIWLPMASVTISGPFGEPVTEAAVSKRDPLGYPYQFSNQSYQLLHERGQKIGEGKVQALTRSKNRQLETQLTQNMGTGAPESERTFQKSVETAEQESTFETVEPEEDILECGGC